jgi:hypothetical protein
LIFLSFNTVINYLSKEKEEEVEEILGEEVIIHEEEVTISTEEEI